jgi:hypothetical protein
MLHKDKKISSSLKEGEAPLTLVGAVIGKIHTATETISNAALGDKIAPGLFISRLEKKPSIHLLKTSAIATLKDPEAAQRALLEKLTKYQLVQGFSPSKNALRMMMVFLRSLPGISEADSKKLRSIRKEAYDIDLNQPKDQKWKKEATIKIGDVSLSLSLSLEKKNLFHRQMAKTFGADIPKDQKGHKYGYHSEITLSNPTKTENLRKIEYGIKRAGTMALTVSPAIVAADLVCIFLSPKLLPIITNNTFMQSCFTFGLRLTVASTAAIAAYFLTFNWLIRKKHT